MILGIHNPQKVVEEHFLLWMADRLEFSEGQGILVFQKIFLGVA
ncbi:MAG: hypothetical protein Ct9H300mP3_07860 [Gammaproteobacteria bacterium]|nr:MAG: hypothetical protein Ct9H300mP3_07860 [Gammaproteobacteria bacterium]